MSDTFSATVPGKPVARPQATLDVELVGDLICPFCYLGKRRVDDAIRSVRGPSHVGFYPFQLNPEMPDAGEPFEDYLAQRFGSRAAIQPVLDRLRAEGREAGIEYRFDRLERVPNTLPAHQVIELADSKGRDTMPLVEGFMSAYLSHGENIGRRDVIVDVARKHGLDPDQVVAAIEDEHLRASVVDKEQRIRASGVNGVPGVLMNRRLLLVGAQATDDIVAGFDRAMFGDADGNAVAAPLH